jgi:DNA-binding transcriptional LysR family regulator
MSLTLRQLEVFLAAAQDCNFRRTARRLGVSQPTVSGRIRSIEAYLGYELFDRSSGSSPQLTHRGRTFIARAQQLVSGATQLSATPKANAASTPLRLKVVIGPWLLTHRVMPALPAFCYDNPGIVGEFEPIGLMTEGRELVGSGEADICLYTGDAPQAAGLEVETLATTGCSIFGSPDLCARTRPTPEAISAAPFIMPPEHHPAAHWMRARLAGVGVSPKNIVVRTQFPDQVLQMMLQGRALSVFFDEFVEGTALRRVGRALQPANRILVIGPRARRPAAAPMLQFLRKVSVQSRESTGKAVASDPVGAPTATPPAGRRGSPCP